MSPGPGEGLEGIKVEEKLVNSILHDMFTEDTEAAGEWWTTGAAHAQSQHLPGPGGSEAGPGQLSLLILASLPQLGLRTHGLMSSFATHCSIGVGTAQGPGAMGPVW